MLSRKLIISSLVLIGLLQGLFAQNASIKEQLIVFTDAQQPILTQEDTKQLKDLTNELQIEFKFVDIKDGAPEEILYTPSIVYQNHVNRSFFYGRYKNIARLKNFIRTSRMMHQQESQNPKKNILLWQHGRTKVTAPIKLTDLQGHLPKAFQQEQFAQKAKQAIIAGMQAFKLQTAFDQSRTTRSFYLDVHPYLSQDGMLYLSGEIYSQFNCVKPIVSMLETPWLSGTWEKRHELFEELGKLMEKAVFEQIQSSNIGDAFAGISEEIASKSWEDLGLAIVKEQQTQKIDSTKKIDIPNQWMVEPVQNSSEPIIIFSFLAPLDNYVGEVKAFTGNLNLGKNQQLTSATGNFEVAIKDVTMGDEGLDDAVQNKMLKMSDFPIASLEFENIVAEKTPLKFAQSQDILVHASFKMIGISIPVEIPAKIEPVLNADGQVRLQVNASFQVPLFEKFKIEGPDGPSPAKDTLQFYLKFYLKPV